MAQIQGRKFLIQDESPSTCNYNLLLLTSVCVMRASEAGLGTAIEHPKRPHGIITKRKEIHYCTVVVDPRLYYASIL